jgi:hypothetical protein
MSAGAPVRTALVDNLTDLHLPAMRGGFEESARRAEKETLSYEQYLLKLTERECEMRDKNRIARLLKESGLPLEKTLANFDLKRLPVKVARQFKVLLDGSFLDRKENLLPAPDGHLAHRRPGLLVEPALQLRQGQIRLRGNPGTATASVAMSANLVAVLRWRQSLRRAWSSDSPRTVGRQATTCWATPISALT